MKIAILSYYDDFSHFYNALFERHKAYNSSVEYTLFTPCLSGYYTCHFTKSFIRSNTFKRDSSPTEFSAYEILSQDELPKYNYSGEYQRLYRELSQIMPDKIILSGDVRPYAKCMLKVAKELNIKCFFFEQGPLATTTFSEYGVTANHHPGSLPETIFNRQLKYMNLYRDKADETTRLQKHRYYRLLDILSVLSPAIEKKFDIGLFIKKIQFKASNVRVVDDSYMSNGRKNILLGLQVPEDVNFLFHSAFASFTQVLKLLIQASAGRFNIVVREHPMYMGKYSKELYDLIDASDTLYLDNTMRVDADYWGRMSAFFSINSLMTFEAVSNRVPAFTLGKSCYGNFSQYCATFEAVKEVLNVLENEEVAVEFDRSTLDEYLCSSFFIGHYRKPTDFLLDNIITYLEI